MNQSTKRENFMWIWLCVIAASVLVDQATKLLTVAKLGEGESVALIPDVLHFTYVQNEGAAFGMLDDHRWVFMVLSVIGIAAVFAYLWKFRPDSKLACVSLSFIMPVSAPPAQ